LGLHATGRPHFLSVGSVNQSFGVLWAYQPDRAQRGLTDMVNFRWAAWVHSGLLDRVPQRGLADEGNFGWAAGLHLEVLDKAHWGLRDRDHSYLAGKLNLQQDAETYFGLADTV
jgi:hypothetical protein